MPWETPEPTPDFGQYPPHQRPNYGRPLLFLEKLPREGDKPGVDIMLVNHRDEILDQVIAGSGSWAKGTGGEAVVPVTSDDYDYRDVQPGEAVKVEHRDEYYDLDFHIEIHIDIRCRSLSNRAYKVDLNKAVKSC